MEILKKLRKEKGLTQTELANLFCPPTNRDMVHRWEKGYRKPSYESLAELSRIFGVPVDSFFEGGEER